MTAPLVALALVTSAAATPDETLVAALGSPRYVVREWAQSRLFVRATTGVYPPAVVACVHAISTTPNYEIRRRAILVVGASAEARLTQAFNLLDDATGLDYPCLDAMLADPSTGAYATEGPRFEMFQHVISSPLPEYTDRPGRIYHSLRVATRHTAAVALVNGYELSDVLDEMGRMHTIDVRYYIRNGIKWDGDWSIYVLACLRWDCRPPVWSPSP